MTNNVMAIMIIFEQANTGAALPLTISVLATAVVFVLVKIATMIYRSGDILIMAKRMSDLDPKVVRLTLTMENLQKSEKKLQDIQIAVKKDKKLCPVASLAGAPIQRYGDTNFLGSNDLGYYFSLLPGSKNEAIVEFHLDEPYRNVYLLGKNLKGQPVKAYVNLDTSEVQMLSFHRA
ncbi:MAG: hypothetical protein J6A47_08090 [Bacilli bacterium]|nr:hypothetical protein [Bacilli bacterium]